MYGNDNYGNSEGNQGIGGRFSGSQSFGNETGENVSVNNSTNNNSSYFNRLDDEKRQISEMSYRNERMYEPVQTYSMNPETESATHPANTTQEEAETVQPASTVQEEAETIQTVNTTQEPAETAHPVNTIQESVNVPQSAGMAQSPVGAANVGGTGSIYSSGRSGVNNGNSTWEQAPVRNGSENGSKPEHSEKKSGLMQKLLLCVSLGLLFGIFAGIGFYGVVQATGAAQGLTDVSLEQDNDKADANDEEIPKNDTPLIQPAVSNIVYNNGLYDVSPIVKQVMPAMVSIINNYTEVSYFWGQTYKEPVSSSGSGIIVAENGKELLIVTNQHVVADAEQLLVTLIDNTEVEAKIKGVDVDMDLAVIAINLDDITDATRAEIAIAELGDSDELEMGEPAIAIGNALGYGMSVTVGHISALDRAIELDDGSVRSFIQTDAAINPGNSGGALLNGSGQVIGINSNKIGGSSIEGMGYAIPITAASPIIADLMERQTRNKVSDSKRGYMGITPQDVTDQIVQMYGMPKGVYVVSVVEGSGAEKAGMKKGDVITKFDGNRIASYADLQDIMQYYAIGDSVKVVVMRPENGEYVEHELTMSLGERPE